MKVLEGIVLSVGMQNTAVVEVIRRVPHPLYKKLMKRSKKYKADTKTVQVLVGDMIRMQETRPLGKDKHFNIVSVITKKGEKKI